MESLVGKSLDKAVLKVGWVGTGVMGKSMCRHLMKAGYKLFIYNRTKEKTEELVKEGAIYSSLENIGKECDVVFTMVGYPRDVDDVVLGEKGLMHNMKKGALLIDHTTSNPALAEKIYIVNILLRL